MSQINRIMKTGAIITSLFLFVISMGYAQKPVKFVQDEKSKKVDVLIDGKSFTEIKFMRF